MGRSHFSGPVKSTNGFEFGNNKVSVSVTVPALAAGAISDISVTVAGALAGDIVAVSPPDSAAEANLAVGLAWVSAANTVKIRLRNTHASAALTGSTANWSVALIK